jgi:hypothetical protein
MECQKLAGEWDFHDSNAITALCVQPDEPSLVMAGYSNGGLLEFDTRISAAEQSGGRLTHSLVDRVVKIAANRNEPEMLYAASSGGKVLGVDMRNRSVEMCFTNRTGIDCFDAHQALPLLIMSSGKDLPGLYGLGGNKLSMVKGGVPGSVFMFHPVLPSVLVGWPNGIVGSYRIVLEGK